MTPRMRATLRILAALALLGPAAFVASRFGRSALAYGAGQECISRAAGQPPARFAATVERARAVACEKLAPAISAAASATPFSLLEAVTVCEGSGGGRPVCSSSKLE